METLITYLQSFAAGARARIRGTFKPEVCDCLAGVERQVRKLDAAADRERAYIERNDETIKQLTGAVAETVLDSEAREKNIERAERVQLNLNKIFG